jgi:hypothetical protein
MPCRLLEGAEQRVRQRLGSAYSALILAQTSLLAALALRLALRCVGWRLRARKRAQA